MIDDSLRGTYGILMDMYDHADELLRLLDIVTEYAIKDSIAGCSEKSSPLS